MPSTYAVCWQGECPKADVCLRRQAALHLPSDRLVSQAVNLNAVSWNDGQCSQYRSTAPSRNAWGLRHIYDNVPKKLSPLLYRLVTSHFSKHLYYQYYNCKKSIPPAHQELIRADFRAMGIETPVEFERYEDIVNW